MQGRKISMKKKILTTFLAAVMAVSMAACSSKTDAPAETPAEGTEAGAQGEQAEATGELPTVGIPISQPYAMPLKRPLTAKLKLLCRTEKAIRLRRTISLTL